MSEIGDGLSSLAEARADAPRLAHRLNAFLFRFFEWCGQSGVPVGNTPGARIEGYREGRPPLRLTDDEAARLHAALTALGQGREALAAAALRFVAQTGLGLAETLALRWQDVDFESRTVRMEGEDRTAFVHPDEASLDILRRLPRGMEDSRIFADALPADDVLTVWARIREAAGLGARDLCELQRPIASVAA
jgi:integrase